LKFFTEDAPADPGENLQQMRVRDLLTMTTGHLDELIPTFSWGARQPPVREFLAWPVAHRPGTYFFYNTPATFMQSAIVQKLSGEKVVDYLGPRLFQPLGIGTPRWDEVPGGYTMGGSGLHLRTEDIACFGQLYLQKGQWQGQQLVPAAWIEAATAKQVSNGSSPTSDWNQGYGFQFWRCRPGFYRGDGAHGQFCIVMPEQDAVIAITSGVRNMQQVMNVVWDKLLPALNHEAALPANPAAEQALRKKLASLTVRGPTNVAAASPQATQFTGRTYVFPQNERGLESLTLQVNGGQTSLVVRGPNYDGTPMVIGHGTWHRGGTTRFGSDFDPRNRRLQDEAVSAVGGWASPDTFVAKLCYHETPYMLTVRLQFGGDLVVLDADYNTAFGNNAFPQLLGRAEPR
jgi:hypothetical protein